LPLTLSHSKEAMSYAHIFATAGMARVSFDAKIHFDYGVDGHFEELVNTEEGHVASGFPVFYQAKASVNWEYDGNEVVYDLDARAYNNIATRKPAAARLILLLLCLPPEIENWHSVTESITTMQRCCYWHWFEGPRVANSSTRRVRIPRSNLFTPEVLKQLLEIERLRQEGAEWTT
jgi:Domain of unknown function (DUF4365)